jgi:ABC-type branched-subunit amino acid transport system substrate-binding protein
VTQSPRPGERPRPCVPLSAPPPKTPPGAPRPFRARWLTLAVAGLLGALLHAGDSAAIRLGLILPPGEPHAAAIRRGAATGVTRARTEHGLEVILLERGTPGQWGTEGDDAVALALDAGAQALIAPTLGTTVHLVEQVAGRTRIPLVSLCSDTSVTGARIPWVLRIVPTTVDEARVLFATIRTGAGEPIRRWAALVPEGRAGREVTRDLGAAAKAGGTDLVSVIAVPATPTNAPAWIARAIRESPAGLLLWLDPATAVPLVSAAREAGYRGALAGPGRLAGKDFLPQVGAAAEGFWTTRLHPPPAARAPRAMGAEDPHGSVGPAEDPLAAAATDAVTLLAAILREAGEGPAFRVLPLKREVAGATGVLKFDAVGNRIVELEAIIVRQGRFEPVTPLW